MKARVPQTPKVILLYNIQANSEKYHKLTEILEGKNVTFKILSENDLSQNIGFLIGFKGFKERPHDKNENVITEECVIMSGFDNKLVNVFLKALKSEQLEITLKAVVTNNNLVWSLSELLQNLLQEHSTLNNSKED